MKKIFGFFITFFAFISTQSFSSSLDIPLFKKITKDSEVAREGTSTCFGRDK